MAQPLKFQQAHLDRVSRSFAFCIQRLPQPLGRWVGGTYLLCRILDTIEDASWENPGAQEFAFSLFEKAISDPHQAIGLVGWERRFPEVPDGEFKLLRDAGLVLEDFYEFPEPVHKSVRDLVLSMASGMRHFVQQCRGGPLRLSSLAEVNQYCFFVAGLVGEALTQLFSSVEPRFKADLGRLLKAHHFGLFLQKVNILKDQLSDERSGRWLVPSRGQVEASAGGNARQALDFLCDIPSEQVEFRQFCAWSLFLGVETLVMAHASFWQKTLGKVSRAHTEKLLRQVDEIITDNQRLREFFFQQAKALGWDFSLGDLNTPSPEWLSRLYRGGLDRQSLLQLGLGQAT